MPSLSFYLLHVIVSLTEMVGVLLQAVRRKTMEHKLRPPFLEVQCQTNTNKRSVVLQCKDEQ